MNLDTNYKQNFINEISNFVKYKLKKTQAFISNIILSRVLCLIVKIALRSKDICLVICILKHWDEVLQIIYKRIMKNNSSKKFIIITTQTVSIVFLGVLDDIQSSNMGFGFKSINRFFIIGQLVIVFLFMACDIII